MSKKVLLLLIFGFFFIPHFCNALTAYPGTVSTQSVLPEDDINWSSSTNIQANDGAYATALIPKFGVTYRLKATNFNFSSIPTNSTIVGIIVEIERKASLIDVLRDYRVQLLDATGTLVGNNLSTLDYYPTTDQIVSYGDMMGDTWGASPTVAMVKDADFGVVFSVITEDLSTSRTVSVDFIRMTVYYIPSEGGATAWGDITGTLSNQTDLQAELDALDFSALYLVMWKGLSFLLGLFIFLNIVLIFINFIKK